MTKTKTKRTPLPAADFFPTHGPARRKSSKDTLDERNRLLTKGPKESHDLPLDLGHLGRATRAGKHAHTTPLRGTLHCRRERDIGDGETLY